MFPHFAYLRITALSHLCKFIAYEIQVEAVKEPIIGLDHCSSQYGVYWGEDHLERETD